MCNGLLDTVALIATIEGTIISAKIVILKSTHYHLYATYHTIVNIYDVVCALKIRDYLHFIEFALFISHEVSDDVLPSKNQALFDYCTNGK